MTFVVLRQHQLNLFINYQKLSYNIKKETGKRWCSKFFITTPIFYINAEPHIGHLYTALIGDAANRFKKLKNPNLKTKFMVGTDEHGLKVKQSADSKNIDIKIYCDQMADKYKSMFQLFNIECDDFIRTTEERHEKAVVALWNKIFSKELIYKDVYSGWYCVADEGFVGEKYLNPNKEEEDGFRYTLDGKQVQFVEETNYKFKLTHFHDDLLRWLEDSVVQPMLYQKAVINLIKEEKIINDISVSRPVTRVPWGIPVPGDPTQTIYVWLDALSSYLAANGYPESNFKWPPNIQIIGKDIIKFHGIFWPAFLMAADLEPPKFIFCHSHWLKNNEKMSKSKKNVVDPIESSKKYTSDGLRYFLLRGGVPHNDGNFSEKKVIKYLNAELADSLGNLLSRCTGQSINPNQVFPALLENYENYFDKACVDLIKSVEGVPEEVSFHFDKLHFYRGIDAIIKILHSVNFFFNERKPWVHKHENNLNHVNVTLHLTMEALRVCGILLQPIIPFTSDILLNQLSVPKNKRNFTDIIPYSWKMSENFRRENWELKIANSKLFVKLKAS